MPSRMPFTSTCRTRTTVSRAAEGSPAAHAMAWSSSVRMLVPIFVCRSLRGIFLDSFCPDALRVRPASASAFKRPPELPNPARPLDHLAGVRAAGQCLNRREPLLFQQQTLGLGQELGHLQDGDEVRLHESRRRATGALC